MSEAEALSEWLEDGDAGLHREARPVERPQGTHHWPQTDAEATRLIEKLNHYRWDTHKVSGRFTHDPYSLMATIDGTLHTIHLRGRFGGVLTWLRDHPEEVR